MMSLQSDDFVLFGLQRQFAQDAAQLERSWKDLQRQAHPDKFADQGPAAQRLAMQWSVRINEAYRRLKDPLQRGAYLCELQGHAVGAESNTAMPSAFLMQQMQWREDLDEATTEAALDALLQEVQAAHRSALKQLAQAIDVDGQWAQAVAQVRALMFIERFMRDVEQKLDHMES
jgi:molecular chaperone HscB